VARRCSCTGREEKAGIEEAEEGRKREWEEEEREKTRGAGRGDGEKRGWGEERRKYSVSGSSCPCSWTVAFYVARVPEVAQDSHRTAQDCHGTATVLPRYCHGTAAVLPRYCHGTATVLPRYHSPLTWTAAFM